MGVFVNGDALCTELISEIDILTDSYDELVNEVSGLFLSIQDVDDDLEKIRKNLGTVKVTSDAVDNTLRFVPGAGPAKLVKLSARTVLNAANETPSI